MVAQPGALWLATVTGNPSVPFHVESRPSWTLPSRDASQIPYPFGRIAVVFGEPIAIPREADDEVLEAKRRELEARLNALQPRALELLE